MLSLEPPAEVAMVPEVSDGDSDSASAQRHFVKSSAGPEPFPGIPQLPPRQPPEPGQVLLRYDVEEGSCTELTRAGWLCFWSLVCAAPICCCLPCCMPCCHARYQRPVYGYPIQCQIIASGLGGGDAKAAVAGQATTGQQAGTAGSEGGSAVPTAPAALQIAIPSVRSAAGGFNSPQASPRPQSIFVPPSAVPATGFSVASPGYPRYKPEPAGSGAGSAPGSATGTPRSAFGGQGLSSSSSPMLSYLAAHQPARQGSPSSANYLAPQQPQQQQQQQQQEHAQSPRQQWPAPPPPLFDERGLAPQWEIEEDGFGGNPGERASGAGSRAQRASGTPPATRPENPMQWRMAARSSSGGGGTWGSRQNSRNVSQDGVTATAPTPSTVAAVIAEGAVGP